MVQLLYSGVAATLGEVHPGFELNFGTPEQLMSLGPKALLRMRMVNLFDEDSVVFTPSISRVPHPNNSAWSSFTLGQLDNDRSFLPINIPILPGCLTFYPKRHFFLG